MLAVQMCAYVPAATDQNTLRIAGYTRVPQSSRSGGVHDPISPHAEAATLTAVPISRNVDGRNHLSLGTNLNTHYIGAMAYPTPITYYYSSSSGSGEVSPGREPGPHDSTGYLQWLDYVLDQSSVQTVSLGYGTQETNIPLEYGWV